VLRALLGRAERESSEDWPARPSRSGLLLRSLQRLVWPPRGLGSIAALSLFVAVGATGFVMGGHLDRLRAEQGSVADMLARAAGFGINEIVITGNKELSRAEVVALSGLSGRDSVAFLDVGAVRDTLKREALIADADVRKLLPDKLAINITERQPFALWQLDGAVKVIAVDGTVIDDLRDERFTRLPFVVGPGANLRVQEYAALLEAVPDIRAQVRAGMLIAERRWTLKLKNGVDVKLPEENTADALRKLAFLNKTDRVLSKDIILVDLRVPGRVAFRLTEEAAAARNAAFDKKYPSKARKPA
jgi:cell division protein FtsQ